MSYYYLLDGLPILGVFALFTLIALVTGEGGYRFGRWWQKSTPDEKEGPTGMIVGALLALMAFLLAITMGMASDRFDARRGAVLAEANSIGTTYLRAGYLPEPASSKVRALLREYVHLRITGDGDMSIHNPSILKTRIERSVELQGELWSITEGLARSTPDSAVLAVFINSLNETIDLHEIRISAGLYARVPETVIVLLLLGAFLTLGMVGYNAGLTGRRSPLSSVVMILVLGAVITLVIDLDRPANGFLKTNQQPLIDLQQQVGVATAS